MSDGKDSQMENEPSSTAPVGVSHPPVDCWDELVSSLNAVKSLENFSSMKAYPLAINPVIRVNEHVIALPLTDNGAEIIKQASTRTKGGNGNEAALDTSVDNVWKLGLKNFNILHPGWPAFLKNILDKVCEDLDITESVDTQPHEILLCEQDGFPQWQDKAQDMEGIIAMLTIYLPSEHRGGEVRLSYAEKDCTFDVSELSMFNTRALAWSADAIYKAEKITSGRRLMLIYQIVDKFAILNSPSTIDQPTGPVSKALRQCVQQAPNFSPKIYLLDHRYPLPELSLRMLKGHDYAICKTLDELCSQHGLYLLLGRLEKHRTTLGHSDVDSDTDESTFCVDLLDYANGVEIAKTVIFPKDQVLNDPFREDRIAGILVSSESSAFGDTVAIICPKIHLASYINPSQSTNLENIIQMVIRDIDDRSDTCEHPEASLGVLEEIVDSWQDSKLPSGVRSRVVQWVWENQYRSLFIKILSSEMSLQVDPQTMVTIAQMINTDICDAEQATLRWGKYFDGAFHPTQDLKNVTMSLEIIGSNILDAFKFSFSAWKMTVQQHMFRNNVSLNWDDIQYFRCSIVPAKEHPDWVLNCLIPALRAPGRKNLLRTTVCELLPGWPNQNNGNRDMVDKILLCTYQTAALEITDFQSESYCQSSASLFLRLVTKSLCAGLTPAVIRLFDASWTNIAPQHASSDASPLMGYKAIIKEFLNHLGWILQFCRFPHIFSTREIFKLFVRRYIYAAAPSYPEKLPGWSHKPRGCGCEICLEVDEFLKSEDFSKGEFIVKDISHLKSRLPRGVIRCVHRSTEEPTDSLVYRLYKIKDKEFEQDVECYNKEVLAFEKDFMTLRNHYMEELFGEADYREFVMLEKVKNSEGHKELVAAAAAIEGKKRKAAESSTDEDKPVIKRSTKA
ncbi:hypothetical protein F4801DRAFT_596327 [Xylaria longipes]|nr:hypothetical protein F4801DRAFT_596327 [Xylaria longipes]